MIGWGEKEKEFKSIDMMINIEVASIMKETNWCYVEDLKQINRELVEKCDVLSRLARNKEIKNKIAIYKEPFLRKQLKDNEDKIKSMNVMTTQTIIASYLSF